MNQFKKLLPKFSTRDLVVIATLIALSGVFQVVWAQLVFSLKFLGPLTPIFSNAGFMVWGYIALYLVRIPGSATLVKGFGAVIEVLLGNPVGLVAIAYGTLEGLAVDVAYVLFKRKLTVYMFIVGALLSQTFNGPIDVVRDAVPLNLNAVMVYFSPGITGTITTGVVSNLIINALRKAGVKPLREEIKK